MVSSSPLKAHIGSILLTMVPWWQAQCTAPHTEWVTNKYWLNEWNSHLNLCNLPSAPFDFKSSPVPSTRCSAEAAFFSKVKCGQFSFFLTTIYYLREEPTSLSYLRNRVPGSLYGFPSSDSFYIPYISGSSCQNAFTQTVVSPRRGSSHLLTTLVLQGLWGWLMWSAQ